MEEKNFLKSIYNLICVFKYVGIYTYVMCGCFIYKYNIYLWMLFIGKYSEVRLYTQTFLEGSEETIFVCIKTDAVLLVV